MYPRAGFRSGGTSAETTLVTCRKPPFLATPKNGCQNEKKENLEKGRESKENPPVKKQRIKQMRLENVGGAGAKPHDETPHGKWQFGRHPRNKTGGQHSHHVMLDSLPRMKVSPKRKFLGQRSRGHAGFVGANLRLGWPARGTPEAEFPKIAAETAGGDCRGKSECWGRKRI